jgi:hypothetical protein
VVKACAIQTSVGTQTDINSNARFYNNLSSFETCQQIAPEKATVKIGGL